VLAFRTFLVSTFRVSKPIKFSLRFINKIVPELTKRPAFEVRKKCRTSFHLARGIFSSINGQFVFLHSFPMQTCPLTLSCSNITYASVYLLRKLGFVSQNGLDRFAFVPSCNQGKLLLTTTNDNVKTSNWIKSKSTSYGIYRRLWVNLSQPSADYITITVHQRGTTDIQTCPIKLPPLFRAPDVWIIPV